MTVSLIKPEIKDVEIKYTFNSFKYMEDFDVADFEGIENHPFKIASLLETLLMGAVNNNPKIRYSIEEVQDFLEEYSKEGNLSDLFTELMDMLQISNFFNSLQKKQ